LEPAGGAHAGLAPARYVEGDKSTFAYETRYIDRAAATTVVIDQKQSQLNRIEAAVVQAIDDKHPVLSRVPRLQVTYGGGKDVYFDLSLPHRAFDGHIRAGSVDGKPVTAHPAYRALRDSAPANARVMLEMAPTGLVFGAWDSTRVTRQARFRSALVGEIIGVLADQESDPGLPVRGGARVDPVGMRVQLTADQLRSLLEDQKSELSPKLIDKVEKVAKQDQGKGASMLGLGGVPPTLNNLGVVSCRRIIRTHVLSFAALRQLRFGAEAAGDAACRALLSAYALAGLARSDAELCLRANCDLLEAAPAVVELDARGGKRIELEPLTVEQSDELLAEALQDASQRAGVSWEGQIFEVTGNPDVYKAAVADPADKE
jgi:CRISPR-associated protein Csb1